MLQDETATSPARMERVLAGLAAYQAAPRVARTETSRVVTEVCGARLLDYGGKVGGGKGRPVLFVPSLINPPYVLDLAPGNSLLAQLATTGVRPLLIDWGDPRAREDLSIAGHVEQIILPMLDAIGTDAALAGYCLGGTMAIGAAARRKTAGLVLIATPWHFDGFPEAGRERASSIWTGMAPMAEQLGLVPMEMLQSIFWQLDPAATVNKFEKFAELEPDSAKARAFVLLEDWANSGTPLSLAAGRELFEDFIIDDLPGQGGWLLGGGLVDPAAIACPVLNIVSTTDRITPSASALRQGEMLELNAGHVGMVVGSRAPDLLWAPIAQWLSEIG